MSILDCESSNPQMVDNPLLKHFVPIKDLTAENRNQMANKSRESTLEMG